MRSTFFGAILAALVGSAVVANEFDFGSEVTVAGIRTPSDARKVLQRTFEIKDGLNSEVGLDNIKWFVNSYNLEEEIFKIQELANTGDLSGQAYLDAIANLAKDYALVGRLKEMGINQGGCETAICLPDNEEFAGFIDPLALKRWLHDVGCERAICLDEFEPTIPISFQELDGILKDSTCDVAICLPEEDGPFIGLPYALIKRTMGCNDAKCIEGQGNEGPPELDDEDEVDDPEIVEEEENEEGVDAENSDPNDTVYATAIVHSDSLVEDDENPGVYHDAHVTVITTHRDETHTATTYSATYQPGVMGPDFQTEEVIVEQVIGVGQTHRPDPNDPGNMIEIPLKDRHKSVVQQFYKPGDKPTTKLP